MGRRKRAYLPGAVFHITARSHCKEHIFDVDLRDVMVDIIARRLPLSDAELIAFAIMSNHYHLVIKQGNAPIAQLLQPINRDIALGFSASFVARDTCSGLRFLIRRAVIANAIRRRHRVRDIARFLNLSDTAVSRVAVTVRPRPPIRFDS